MILSETRRDVLTELINVGLGHAAGVMNEMTGLPVKLDLPKVELLSAEEIGLAFRRRLGERVSSVCLDFEGGFAGRATLVFPAASAVKLVAALHGLEWDPRGEVPELPAGADPVGDLQEIGNVLIHSVLGAVANGLRQRLDFSVPIAAQQTVHDLVAKGVEDTPQLILAATTGFSVEHLQLDGLVTLLFQVGSVERLMEAIDAVSFGG
jgi:chemotaxis protein CheC